MNMATYPIKVLKDETGIPFVPLVSSTGITNPDGTTLEDSLNIKLESANIIAGDNIILTKEGNDITITGTASGAANRVIDSLDTIESNVGVLDAHQGYVLNNKITEMAETLEGGIPQVINNCTTVDTVNALSAYQGYLLNNKFNDYALSSTLNDYALKTDLNNYLPLSGGTITSNLTVNGELKGNSGVGLVVRSNNTGSWKEGIRIYPASNNYALVYMGNEETTNGLSIVHNPVSKVYYFDVIKDNTTRVINIPHADGTMALTNGGVAYTTTGGRLTAGTTTARQAGLRMYEIYNNGYPFTYGNVLQMNGANGVSQLALQWHGTEMYYRSAPDTSTTFSSWARVWNSNNITPATSFVQSSQPTAARTGDIWFVT